MFRLLSIGALSGGAALSDCFTRSNCDSHTPNQRLHDEFAMQQLVSRSTYHVKSSYSNGREGFYLVYDSKTRNPAYVVEKLSRFDSVDSDAKKVSKRPPFFPEYLITDDQFRVHPKDYNDSSYDRGHMVPAADFMKDPQQYEKTFSMANISPQAPVLNQGFWSRFEAWIRHYLLRYIFEEAIIITGPVFAPVFIDNRWVYVHRTVGTFPNLIQVPTHFFKVILGKRKDGDASIVAAFLVPNVDTVSKTDSIMSYLVKLGQLESIVGFRFFPSLIDIKERDKIDAVVPEERDLVNILNANNMLNSSSKKLSSWSDIGNPMNVLNVNFEGKTNSTSLSTKKKLQSSGILHLCESGVDCSKCMFKPN